MENAGGGSVDCVWVDGRAVRLLSTLSAECTAMLATAAAATMGEPTAEAEAVTRLLWTAMHPDEHEAMMTTESTTLAVPWTLSIGRGPTKAATTASVVRRLAATAAAVAGGTDETVAALTAAVTAAESRAAREAARAEVVSTPSTPANALCPLIL